MPQNPSRDKVGEISTTNERSKTLLPIWWIIRQWEIAQRVLPSFIIIRMEWGRRFKTVHACVKIQSDFMLVNMNQEGLKR